MALPLIGAAVRAIMAGIMRDAVKISAPTITVSLSEDGRGIRRWARRGARRTRFTAASASNWLGKIVRVEAREALAEMLEVSPATVRKVEKAQAAYRGSKKPAYTVSWRPDRMPVARVRSKQFTAYPKTGGKRGKLSLKLWKSGRRVVLEGVEKRGKAFVLPAGGGRPERAVGGPRITRGSAPSRAALDPIRKGLKKRYKREFRRQLRRRRGRP